MEYSFKYEFDNEIELIIEQNKKLTLIRQEKLSSGNYLIFTDEEVKNEPTEIEIMQEKINQLEKELTQMQTSIDSLMAITLEKK